MSILDKKAPPAAADASAGPSDDGQTHSGAHAVANGGSGAVPTASPSSPGRLSGVQEKGAGADRAVAPPRPKGSAASAAGENSSVFRPPHRPAPASPARPPPTAAPSDPEAPPPRAPPGSATSSGGFPAVRAGPGSATSSGGFPAVLAGPGSATSSGGFPAVVTSARGAATGGGVVSSARSDLAGGVVAGSAGGSPTNGAVSGGTTAGGGLPAVSRVAARTGGADARVPDDEPMPPTNRLPRTGESIDWDDPPGWSENAGHEAEPDHEAVAGVAFADDPYVGTVLADRYVVDAVLGEGGMGRVYKAHHKVIGKKVAIKVLHAELAKDKESVGRFVREAQAASSIGNPHIVDISDFGDLPDGSTYFVMEYLDGVALGDLIEQQHALPANQVCEIALQLCDGLQAAHEQKIVHRDLKPDNITLITQGANKGFCKILDFGIAKVSGGTSNTKLTMAGAVFGTPHYMSPEQAAGAAVDHRTDIYSLGVMLYEMVSGQMPFNADNFMGILTQHMYKAPVPIRALVGVPDCPPGLEAIILKCLSKKPDARYQSMQELGADIRKLMQTGLPDAVQEMMARSGAFNVPADYFNRVGSAMVPASPAGRRRRLGPRVVAAVGVAVAVLAVLVVILRDRIGTAETKTDRPAPGTSTAASEPQPSAATKMLPVLVYAEPADAVAVVDGKRVKLPETFNIPEGETLALVVEAGKDYASKRVVLDGREAKVKLTLDRKPAAGLPTARSSAAPTVPTPPSGWRPPGSQKPPPPPDVVDPWGTH